MTYEDDAAKVTEISRELRALDLDTTTAEQIARRTRLEVGRRPSRLRTIEAAVAAIIVIAYFVWAIIKVVDALG